MSKTALVLVGDEGSNPDAVLLNRFLEERGFAVDTSRLDLSLESPNIPQIPNSPDLVILDLVSSPVENHARLIECSGQLRASEKFRETQIPIVAITAACENQKLDLLSRFDDVFEAPITDEQFHARLQSLMRLSTMRREAVRRSKTSHKFGVGLPVLPPPRIIEDARFLVVGKGMTFLPLQNAMPAGNSFIGALTQLMAETYLVHHTFDAIIIDMDEKQDHLIGFIESLRNNPRFFDLPILVTCPESAVELAVTALASGATDLISFPFDREQIFGRLMAMVREHRYRDQLGKLFREAKNLTPTDELTHLYSDKFFNEHLGATITDCKDFQRPVTLAGFTISVDGQNSTLNQEQKETAIAKAGRVLQDLIRGEDMISRLDHERFVAIFPDMTLESAATAVRRIRAVVNHTPVSLEINGNPINLYLEGALIAISGEETQETLIKQLFEEPEISI
ncbi:MAG: hypothetical protein COB90_00880 [Hyphomicrobiales bacterium]|nr:MAG: hypothetical protein COB90_00880 [Hyphomicrobiales bacterium]